VGERDHDRELRRMRVRYVAAGEGMRAAWRALVKAKLSLNPGPYGGSPDPWTADQVQALCALRDALTQLIDARRTWDAHRDEWRPSH
jgi:hypothetical protein